VAILHFSNKLGRQSGKLQAGGLIVDFRQGNILATTFGLALWSIQLSMKWLEGTLPPEQCDWSVKLIYAKAEVKKASIPLTYTSS
jgi:hypothetical protein